MNIAIFASAFHPSLGGVEELVKQHALQLKRMGHEPTIVTNRWPSDLPEEEVYQGLTVRRFAFRVPTNEPRPMVKFLIHGPSTIARVNDMLRERRADVIHIQCVSTNSYYAMAAKQKLGLPLVTTMQGELTMDATQLFQRSASARALLKRTVLESDIVTGCSRKTLNDVEEFTGVRLGERGRVIFNGANIDDFAGPDALRSIHQYPRPYIFAMGRVVPQKGFDVLLQAFACAAIASHDLLIAGDGPERGVLEALAQSLGIGDRVRFVGRADHDQVVAYLNGCSFFALPSRTDEGLPVVSAEAMAAGKAIVGTSVGGIPEAVVDGETGLIVPREDAEALAIALKRLTNEPATVEKMGRAALKRAPLFSWPVISAQYVDAYVQAARSKGRSRASHRPVT